MFHPNRAATFAKCAFIYLTSEVLLRLVATAWMVRPPPHTLVDQLSYKIPILPIFLFALRSRVRLMGAIYTTRW